MAQELKISAMNEELFNLLICDLYNNIKEASFRECLANALDANTLAKSTKKVHVHFGVNDITIRDYGRSMKKSVMESVYANLMTSTKKHDKSSTGEYGIGSKAMYGLIYKLIKNPEFKNFTTTTFINGEKTLYIMNFSSQNIPRYDDVYTIPTFEPDGTEVCFPNIFTRETADIDSIIKILWPVKDLIDVTYDSKYMKSILEKIDDIYKVSNNIYYTNNAFLKQSNKILVKFKNIIYPIDLEHFGINSNVKDDCIINDICEKSVGYITKSFITHFFLSSNFIYEITDYTLDLKIKKSRDAFDLEDAFTYSTLREELVNLIIHEIHSVSSAYVKLYDHFSSEFNDTINTLKYHHLFIMPDVYARNTINDCTVFYLLKNIFNNDVYQEMVNFVKNEKIEKYFQMNLSAFFKDIVHYSNFKNVPILANENTRLDYAEISNFIVRNYTSEYFSKNNIDDGKKYDILFKHIDSIKFNKKDKTFVINDFINSLFQEDKQTLIICKDSTAYKKPLSHYIIEEWDNYAGNETVDIFITNLDYEYISILNNISSKVKVLKSTDLIKQYKKFAKNNKKKTQNTIVNKNIKGILSLYEFHSFKDKMQKKNYSYLKTIKFNSLRESIENENVEHIFLYDVQANNNQNILNICGKDYTFNFNYSEYDYTASHISDDLRFFKLSTKDDSYKIKLVELMIKRTKLENTILPYKSCLVVIDSKQVDKKVLEWLKDSSEDLVEYIRENSIDDINETKYINIINENTFKRIINENFQLGNTMFENIVNLLAKMNWLNETETETEIKYKNVFEEKLTKVEIDLVLKDGIREFIANLLLDEQFKLTLECSRLYSYMLCGNSFHRLVNILIDKYDVKNCFKKFEING